MTWVIGLDPGTRAVASVVCPRRGILAVTSVEAQEVEGAVAKAAALLTKAREMAGGDLELVVEGQWVPRPTDGLNGHQGPRHNPATRDKLIELRVAWQATAALLRIPSVVVKPSTWQTVNDEPKKDEAGKKIPIKERSIAFARRHWTHVPNDNYADAIGIGLWRIRGGRTPAERSGDG